MKPLHNLALTRLVYERLTHLWAPLADEVTQKRLGDHDRASAQGYLKGVAQAEMAHHQADQLETIANTAWPEPLQHLITFAVGIFGALVVGSSAMGLISSTGRGPVAAAGGAIAGGASAILADIYATRYFMRRRMHYAFLQTLSQIQAERDQLKSPTVFQLHWYQYQEQLVQQVEAQYWAEEPQSEKAMAIAALSAEGIIALMVSFPAGLSLALASAAIPIVINLLVAKVQSDRFDIPDACAQLIPSYEVHIPDESILALEALPIVRLDAALQYLSNSRPPHTIRSVEQAQGFAQAKFAQERVAELEALGTTTVTERKQQFQSDLENVPNRCPEPDVDVQGLNPPQAEALKKQWREEWIAEEIRKLEEKFYDDLESIKQEFGRAIAFWKQLEAQGFDEYRNAEPIQHEPPKAA